MDWVRSNILGLIAIFIALSGTAFAAGLARDSVKAKQIKSGAVRSDEVQDDSLTGGDIQESSLAQVPTAGTAGSAGSAPPVGPAGGELAGSYPNPTIGTVSGLDLVNSSTPGDGLNIGPLQLYKGADPPNEHWRFNRDVVAEGTLASEEAAPPFRFAGLSAVEGLVMSEGSDTDDPGPNAAKIVVVDGPGGATQIRAVFPGADQVVIATDPTP